MAHKEIDDEDERFMQCERMQVDESPEIYAQHLRSLRDNPERSFLEFKRAEAEHANGFAFARVLSKTSSGEEMWRALEELKRK